MNNITAITQGLDFTVRIQARRIGYNRYVKVSFEEINNITVNLINLPSEKTPLAYTIDNMGRLIIPVSGETLVCNTYGLEITGFYNNGNWRHQIMPLVEIVHNSTEDNYALNETDDRTIDFNITIGETYVSSRVFTKTVDDISNSLAEKGATIDQINNDLAEKGAAIEQLEEEIGEAGKVDDVKVNGSSVVTNKEAIITIPTKTSDLQNDSNFVTDEEMQDAMEDKQDAFAGVNLVYEEDGGQPSGSAEFENGALKIGLKNLKMKFADLTAAEKEELRGPEGKPGESVLVGQGDLPLANNLGTSSEKAITQKTVTDRLFVSDKNVPVTNASPVDGYINASNNWTSSSSGNIQSVFLPCKPGKAYKMVGSSISSTTYAFVKSNVIANQPDFATGVTGRATIEQNSIVVDIAPLDAEYLYVLIKSSTGDLSPSIEEGHIVSTEVEQIKEELNDQIMWEPIDLSKYPAYNQEMIVPSTGKWNCNVNTSTTKCAIKFIPLTGIKRIKLLKNTVNTGTVRYAFLTATTRSQNSIPYWSKELTVIKAIPEMGIVWDVPSDAEYLYIIVKYDDEDRTPSVFTYKPMQDVVRELQLESNGRYMQPVDWIQQYEHCNINSSGEFVTYEPGDQYYDTFLLRKYAITQGKEYFAKSIITANSSRGTVVYYDNNDEFIGFDEFFFKPTGVVYNQYGKLTIPSNAVTVIVCGYKMTSGSRTAPILYEGKNKEKNNVTPFVIDYHIARIRSNIITTHTDTDPTSATQIIDTFIDSPWAVMWPNSYTPFGKPTQVVAMLHGSNGLVTPSIMGYYNHNSWEAWRGKYLEEGYAVIDINGFGITTGTTSDDNSKHYGCPAAVATLDIAFRYLKENYNVCDKLLIQGSSMGGGLAQNYAFTHPENVIAVAVLASVFTMKSASMRDDIAQRWGYANNAAAVADEFKNFVGTCAFAQCFAWKDGELTQVSWKKIVEDAANKGITAYEEVETYDLIERYPVPIRFWQGLADETVPPEASMQVIEGYRRGNSKATLRFVEGAPHNMVSGSVPFVVDEVMDWFKRFVK